MYQGSYFLLLAAGLLEFLGKLVILVYQRIDCKVEFVHLLDHVDVGVDQDILQGFGQSLDQGGSGVNWLRGLGELVELRRASGSLFVLVGEGRNGLCTEW